MWDLVDFAWPSLRPLLAVGLGLFIVSLVRIGALRRAGPRFAARDRLLAAAVELARVPARRAALEHARYREWLGPSRMLPTLAAVSVGWAYVAGMSCYLTNFGHYNRLDRVYILALATGGALDIVLGGYAVATIAIGLRAVCGVVVTRTVPAWRQFEVDAWRAAMRSPAQLTVLLFGVTPCVWALVVFVQYLDGNFLFTWPRVGALRADVADGLRPTDCVVSVPVPERDVQTPFDERIPACVRDGADVVVRAEEGIQVGHVILFVDLAYSKGAASVSVDPRGGSPGAPTAPPAARAASGSAP